MTNHKVHNSILRAYDIRGLYDKTLFDKDAFFVGKSFASFLVKNNKKKISIACDGRVSSPALKEQLIKALIESGLEVFDVGMGPTPMLYFSVFHLHCDAGIMVTGSHNPKDHNGFKMMLRDRPFFGDDILGLAELAKNRPLSIFANQQRNPKIIENTKKYEKNTIQKYGQIRKQYDSGLPGNWKYEKKNTIRAQIVFLL
jgi:phosphomannomutase